MMSEHNPVRYSPMSLERHSPEAIAALIYESAPALFRLMFGSQPRAAKRLADLVRRSHNHFSHRHVRVAEIDHGTDHSIDHGIVGMAVMIPAEQLGNDADCQTLSGPQQLWLALLQSLLLRHLLQHSYPAGSFYIGNLAVAPEYRNRGIGRQLLSQCIAEANATAVFISVDIDNPRAQKLYESLGFRVTETKTICLLGQAIGSRVLSLSSSRVYIRKPAADDLQKLLSLRQRGKAFHAPWVSLSLSKQKCRDYINRCRNKDFEGLLICQAADNEIVGVVNLSQIFYGAFQNAYLGYYADVEFAGQGLMAEGVGLAIAHAFETLKLHRLEANIQPENAASIGLVKRLGFTQEGFSPRYLKINGEWRDHERWALTVEDWRKRR
ncbi:MAG: GNAT family N-acetyltransferase [Elainellaceae cyanobacterium]